MGAKLLTTVDMMSLDSWWAKSWWWWYGYRTKD